MGYKDFKKKHRDKIVLAIIILLFLEFGYSMFCFLYLNNPQNLVSFSLNDEIAKSKINFDNVLTFAVNGNGTKPTTKIVSAYDLMPKFEELNHKRDINLFAMIIDSLILLYIYINEKLNKINL